MKNVLQSFCVNNGLSPILLLLMLLMLGTSCEIVRSAPRDYTSNKSRSKRPLPKAKKYHGKKKPVQKRSQYAGTIFEENFKSRTTAPKRTVKKSTSPVKRSALSRSRKEVISYALTFQGVPYRFGGEAPSNGFDCSGFTQYIFEKHGKSIPRNSGMQSKEGVRIPFKEVKGGDLIFFGGEGKVSHVAMVVENESDKIKVIHSTSSKGVIVSDISSSEYWQNKMLFARNVFD